MSYSLPPSDVQISQKQFMRLFLKPMLSKMNRFLTQTAPFAQGLVKTCGLKTSFCMRFCVHHLFILAFMSSAFMMNGCSFTPTTVVQQPLTAKPAPTPPTSANSGAIFNGRAYRPMFEDRKARYVGDIITINIRENTSATKANGSSGGKDGEINSSVTSLFGKALPTAAIDATGSSKYEDSAAANASNVFSGSITTTVVEVLANGNLIVSGEKQVSLDKGTEFVRFSGVVNPDLITIGNFVSSTSVADARVEYRTSSKIDAAEVANAVSRFFLSIGGF